MADSDSQRIDSLRQAIGMLESVGLLERAVRIDVGFDGVSVTLGASVAKPQLSGDSGGFEVERSTADETIRRFLPGAALPERK